MAKTPGSFYHIKQLSDGISEGITMDIIKIKAEVYQLEQQGKRLLICIICRTCGSRSRSLRV